MNGKDIVKSCRQSAEYDLGFILISFKKCLDTAFQKYINNYDTKKDNIYC